MEVSSPRLEGIAADGIGAFLDAVERDPTIEPHGLIIQRHGRRVVEGYWAPHTKADKRLVYSLSKTFTGTALGLLLGEGRLGLDDLVSDHLPDLMDGAEPVTRRIRVRHLVSLTTGHDRETIDEAIERDAEDVVRGFFTIPPDHEPGSRWTYNQPPVLALATILQRVAGERLVDYLRPRLLAPLGITDFAWARMGGVDMGFSGVYTTLDAIARLGQLYLDDGMWDGRRILPEGWVADASAPHITNAQQTEPDWRQGYGFLLWRSRHGYRGDGAFGQYMVVLPDHDAVVAMFSCTEHMQAVLDLMWEHLLPAMGAGVSSAVADDAALARRLERLFLPTVAGRMNGRAPELPTMTFLPGPVDPRSHRTVSSIETAAGRVVIHEDDVSFEVAVSRDWTLTPSAGLAASAAHLADGRVGIDLVLLDTPHRLEIELDTSTGTFGTRWSAVPILRTGNDDRLASMRAPAG